MKFKGLYISLLLLVITVVFSISLFIKGYDSSDKDNYIFLLFIIVIIIIPVLLALLITLFKKSLFHPFYWFFSLLIFASVIFLKQKAKANLLPYEQESYYVSKYFSAKAGWFTKYSPIVVFNQDVDSNTNVHLKLEKCLYYLGSKKLSNYYMGKIQVDTNYNVIREIYNKRIIDDTALLRKEFGRSLKRLIEVEKIINR
jgi:energy-coupling factor transporter transmembrane protein EcfT